MTGGRTLWFAGLAWVCAVARAQDAWVPADGDVISGYAPEGEAIGRPLDEMEWVVASEGADDGTQYWAIPTGAGEESDTIGNVSVDEIVRNRQSSGPSGSVTIQQAPPTPEPLPPVTNVPKDAQVLPTDMPDLPTERIAPGGGVDSGTEDTFRSAVDAPKQPMGEDTVDADDPCLTAPWTATCPNPCTFDATYFMCPDDPCVLDPGGSSCADLCGTDDRYPTCTNDVCATDPPHEYICPLPCDVADTYKFCANDTCIAHWKETQCPDPCVVSDEYPGCTNDVCVSDPKTWKCPDPCIYGTSYTGCSTDPVDPTDPDDPDAAWTPSPRGPLLAILTALVLPFVI